MAVYLKRQFVYETACLSEIFGPLANYFSPTNLPTDILRTSTIQTALTTTSDIDFSQVTKVKHQYAL